MANNYISQGYTEGMSEEELLKRKAAARARQESLPPVNTTENALLTMANQLYRKGLKGAGEEIVESAQTSGQAVADVGGKIMYGSEGRPAPLAVKPQVALPSNFLKTAVAGIGESAIPKRGPTLDSMYPKKNVVTASTSAPPSVIAELPIKQSMARQMKQTAMSEQEKKIKAYNDFMQGSLERGKAAVERWNASPERYGYSAYKPGDVAAKEARNFRAAEAEKARQLSAAEAEKSRISTSDVEKFKASEAARGAIGKESAQQERDIAKIQAQTEAKQKLAEGKPTTEKERVAMMKDLTQIITSSEPDSDAYKIAYGKLQQLIAGDNVSDKNKTLTPALIEEYKKRAGGDSKKAAELAKADGYSVV